MRVLFATGSAASYMLPPRLGEEQVNCGPDWADENAPDGQVRSLATPVGEYDLFALASRLPPGQQPDAVVCLVDASWRNLPRNLAAFKCPRVLLVADTHHLNSPLINMLRYATAEPFDRIVFLYDRHHAEFFAAAGLRNLYWFPGLTFPHEDAAVRAVRRARRRQEIMFVGQAGRFHPRRSRLLEALAARGLPIGRKAVPQSVGLGLYGASLLGFNASLNGDLNLRAFEILAAGAALLTDRLAPASGLADLWTDGREMLTYGSAEELTERAAHALAHPRETTAVGAAGAAWFDRHFNARRRRTAFQALALDGTAAPEFALPAANPTRVLFNGDTDRLIDALAVYEGLQEMHRETETVQVTHAADVPDDISSIWATLPRIQVSHEADAAEADVGIFGRTTEQVPPARCLWCWNADAADGLRLEQAFVPHGFSRLNEQLALFVRTAAEPEPIPAPADHRPHVLLYTDDPEHGGVAHYNHSLLLALARAGHRVTCMQTHSDGALVAAQRAAGVRHHWIDFDTSREFARTVTDGAAALRILAADRPDLVIFSDCCPFSNLAAREAARQLGIPYVVVIGFVGAYLAETFAGQLPALAAQYAAARAVVAVSQENLDLLRTRFGLAANHGQVIHYGRPEEFFQPRDEAVRARLRAGLGVPAEAVVCFTAARLTGVKRHDLQLEAITQLMAGRTKSDLHFVWAGDGDQRAVLEKEIPRRGLARSVHLLGRRPDVRDWYDAADIFVLPSQLEGMPLAIMEAMAKGLPVIATAVSGIPEELGDTGKLLPNPAADPRGVVGGLVGTISNWAAHPAARDAVGRRGRERAMRMFREERMLELTLDLVARQLQVSPPAEPPHDAEAASGSTARPVAATPAGFIPQLVEFFKGSKLLQIDWRDGATATIIQHDDGQTTGPAREVKTAGAAPRLPLPDGSIDTVFNLGSLNVVPDAALAGWLVELHRLTGRNVWIALDALPGRNQVWWERKFFEVGFRKHPLMSLVVPYPASERDESRVMLVLEKIPAAALAQYPLSALKAERDLHMDMLREAGVRSEAHLARYQLAARHARDGGVILDAACGLGYGSAMLARQFPHARVIGVDISEYAIDYARANFAGVLPNLEFHLADACNLSMIGEGTVDLVISFETIEHVPDPGLFLRGAVQRMKAGATFIGSIPNLWLDETGKDPNPWHFHVFDLPKFYQLMAGFLHVSHVYRENAGGHLRNTASGPDLRAVQLPVTDQLEEAEWWIIAATKTPAALAATGTKPRIWLIDGEIRGRFYVQLQESFEAEWLMGGSIQPENLDLAIVSDEWWGPSSVEVQRLKRLGVPTLHVVDGVVDWKNTWENPRSLSAAAGLPLFQPVLSDKIACLGQAQARVLGTWGNAAKCEIVGAPRFDRYYALKRRKRTAEMPARILIVTANTPYFNEQQHADILEGLKDLKEFFALAAQEGIPIEPVWRLTKGLDAELGLTPAVTAARELADVLVTVDAVIGSSSTALLEAMLLGLPTALLDYSNCPHYLQPAWQITAARQIPLVVGELVNPPPAKMLEQETVLHDNLECASPATARLIQLVTVMIEEGRRARRCGEMPSFRPQMLSPGAPVQILPENRFSLAKLYPDHPVFRIDSIAELQAELNHWRKNHSESIWKSYALLTVQWRSKLEAATILSGLGQSEAAVDLMMQSLKVVESCNQPEVVMEAVLEVSTHLAPHDANRTRRLLAMALNLARRLGRADAIQRATQMLEALSPLDSKMAS